MSHPLRVRGLKPDKQRVALIYKESHPLRVRGLKHGNHCELDQGVIVASFTGAWIETECANVINNRL